MAPGDGRTAAVRVYIAVSLDGYIADADGGVGWLEPFEAEDFGFPAFFGEVGAVLMGRRTYDQIRALSDHWPYGETPVGVVTSREMAGEAADTVACHPDPGAALAWAREAAGLGDIWACGGGRLIRQLLDRNAVDTLEIHVMPVLLGTGVPLFERAARGHRLALRDSRPLARGVVRLVYALSERMP